MPYTDNADRSKGTIFGHAVCADNERATNVAERLRQEIDSKGHDGTVRVYPRRIQADHCTVEMFVVIARSRGLHPRFSELLDYLSARPTGRGFTAGYAHRLSRADGQEVSQSTALYWARKAEGLGLVTIQVERQFDRVRTYGRFVFGGSVQCRRDRAIIRITEAGRNALSGNPGETNAA